MACAAGCHPRDGTAGPYQPAVDTTERGSHTSHYQKATLTTQICSDSHPGNPMSHVWVSFFQAGRWEGSRRRISSCCPQQHSSLSPPSRAFLCLTDQCQPLPSPGGCKHILPSVLQFDRHSHCCLLTPSKSLQNPGLLHRVKVMDEEELYPADSNLSLLVLKGCFTSGSH